MEPSTGWFLENAWLISVIPGAAFFIIILFGKRLPMKGSEVGIASMAAALVLSIGTAWQWIQRTDSAAEGAFVPPVIRSWTWWQSGGVEFSIGEYIDGLAAVLLLLVAFISLLVQIYSIEYLRGDRQGQPAREAGNHRQKMLRARFRVNGGTVGDDSAMRHELVPDVLTIKAGEAR